MVNHIEIFFTKCHHHRRRRGNRIRTEKIKLQIFKLRNALTYNFTSATKFNKHSPRRIQIL